MTIPCWNRRSLVVTIVMASAMLSSACGFQLRGLHAMDRKPAWPEIRLDCPEQEKFFCNRLRDQLIQAGSKVIEIGRRTDGFPTGDANAFAPSAKAAEPIEEAISQGNPTAEGGDLTSPDTDPVPGEATSAGTASDARRVTPVPTLKILSLVGGRRAVTLTANAGAAEFEVSRAVIFEITEGSVILLPAATLRQFQTYRYDSSSVLGKDKEETQIKNDLDNLLAYQIANRVAIEGIKKTGSTDAH